MKNESTTDRIIRGIVGIMLILTAYFWLSGFLMIALYVIGAILLITAITGFCFLYTLLGISTRKKPEQSNPTRPNAR